MNPSILLIRSDLPDTAYMADKSVKVLRGSADDWPLLEEELAAWQKNQKDITSANEVARSPHPPGFAAGYFAYDGSFEFQFYPMYQIISPSELGFIQQADLQSGLSKIKGSSTWHSHTSPERYEGMVREAQEYIRAGDIYQINLARKCSLSVSAFDPFLFFRAIWQRTQAPQSAFLRLSDRVLMSASPELFLSIEGRKILTQPIKGTRPRKSNLEEDRKEADELEASVKERAELVMITDLERNDLGKICDYGSVRVPELMKRVSFSHVHHLISTVEGTLRSSVTPIQALHACFPGGSVTGAPKKRAMEIISELENEPRGFYTGAIGYFGFDGSARFNIAIRTCEYQNETLSFFVGSGITLLSSPKLEYEETCHKARAIEEAYELYTTLAAR